MSSRKKTYRSKSLLIVLTALAGGGYIFYLCLQPFAGLQTATTFHFSRSPEPTSVDWPAYGESAIGATQFGVLATHGPQTPLPTASVIKVLTALAVLQKKPLATNEAGPLITITAEDVASYNSYIARNGSVVGVAAGEQLTESQALEALLLPSANNIAETLARWAFGSLDAYVTYANSYAKTLGMQHTTVTDPSGLSNATVSTPSDLILLGEAALDHPLLARIVNQVSATIPVQGAIYNVNNVLGQEGIVGIKTGNNDGDAGCFLVAAKQIIGVHIVTAIGVIMGGPDLPTVLHDALPLVQSMKSDFTSVHVVSADQTVGSITVPWSGTVPITAMADTSILFWKDAQVRGSFSLNQTHPPIASGESVGSFVIHDSRRTHTISIPAQAAARIPSPSLWHRLTHIL
jgi:serine-type D-Ala-D-Ala carboxypeptidase (penicillin-binding protein 5/6)